MIIASWMIMWLQDHDHVVSDAERGGDAMMNPVAAFGIRCSRRARPGPRVTPDTSRARSTSFSHERRALGFVVRARERGQRVRRVPVTFETVRRR
jgi:hypothetical protein